MAAASGLLYLCLCPPLHLPLLLVLQVSHETRLDDRDRLTTVVKRQRRYLGSIAVPFFELYSHGGRAVGGERGGRPQSSPHSSLSLSPPPPRPGGYLHGELRVDAPSVLLGYRMPGVVHVGPSTAGGAPGGASRSGPQGGAGGPPGAPQAMAVAMPAVGGAEVGLLAQVSRL